MSGRTISISREISAPIERVWRAWTSPQDIAHWFVAEHGLDTEVIQMDVKKGGRARLKFPGAAGEYTWTYVEIDKPVKLVIDILDYSLPQFLPNGAGGICNIEFEESGGKTRVTVSGELPAGMDGEKERKTAEKGWGFTLGNLNNYVEEA
jgi:uncharacterized protein YndB with AHSA1/START domain